MDTPLESFLFDMETQASAKDKKKILSLFANCDELDLFFEDNLKINFSYNPYLYSPDFIKSELGKLGIPEKTEKKRNIFLRFLDQLAKDNKEVTGGCPLDCCHLGAKPLPEKK